MSEARKLGHLVRSDSSNTLAHNERWHLPSPCYYGHLFMRDSFFGFPVGKPYCIRCGKKVT